MDVNWGWLFDGWVLGLMTFGIIALIVKGTGRNREGWDDDPDDDDA